MTGVAAGAAAVQRPPEYRHLIEPPSLRDYRLVDYYWHLWVCRWMMAQRVYDDLEYHYWRALFVGWFEIRRSYAAALRAAARGVAA